MLELLLSLVLGFEQSVAQLFFEEISFCQTRVVFKGEIVRRLAEKNMSADIGATADAAARAVASMFIVLGVGVVFALAGKLDREGLRAIGVTINWYVRGERPIEKYDISSLTSCIS